jgi:hypothetical protein
LDADFVWPAVEASKPRISFQERKEVTTMMPKLTKKYLRERSAQARS